jgi:hypothetical protein
LLIKQLRRLRHRHPNELTLPSPSTTTLPSTLTSCKHLQGLHRRRSTHIVRAGLLATTSSTIHLLMLAHRVVLIDIFVLEMLFLARQHAQRVAEE